MNTNEPTKFAVSISSMAKMVGLSRARFYQLMESGVFPRPERHAETNRPFYSEEQQKVVLEVRRRNCGINGQAVLFYARRLPGITPPAKPRRARPAPQVEPHADLIAAVQALGLAGVTPLQAAKAVAETFPNGVAGVDHGALVRAVFLRLKLGLNDRPAGAG